MCACVQDREGKKRGSGQAAVYRLSELVLFRAARCDHECITLLSLRSTPL